MPDGTDAPRRGVARLLPRQMELVADRTSKILIYRGGYRSGKTTGLVAKAIDNGLRHWPHPVLAVEPSFPMIRSVFVASAVKLCREWKLACRWQESKKTLTIGDRRPVTIWCRSADSPRSLEGLTVGSLVGDEWELWDVEALKVAMARVSIGPAQQIVLGGTPEGFGPGYELLEARPKPGTRVIVSRTTDNFFVRADYAADMRSRFSEAEAREKLEGERAAPEGRVFTRFEKDLHLNFCAVDMRRARMEVWAGFNEAVMAWAFVLVDPDRKAFHVAGELVGRHSDSQAMAEEAMTWLLEWHAANGYPRISRPEVRQMKIAAVCDPEGQARTARAPLSHIANLQEVGFAPQYAKRNALVEDRIASMQKALAERRISFDESAAPYFVKCIAQQRKGPDGAPLLEHDLQHGASALCNGVMWHAPAFRPGTAYQETTRARSWTRAKEAPVAEPLRADILRKLPGLLRNRMAQASPGKKLAGDAVSDLGCTIAEFARYIEGKFSDGMTWDNHGVHGWHLDHIRPLASFDLTVREQFQEAASHTNYQPLWARENKSKGMKWNGG